jgi:hypothetical protein
MQPIDAGSAQPELDPVTSLETSAICVGQRAMVPRSRMVARELTGSNTRVSRSEMPVGVSYEVSNQEAFVYFAFDPNLPRTPDTATVRTMLNYAYVDFRLKQPEGIGGGLELLSGNTILHLEAFERLEVQDRELKWRLVQKSEEHYPKPLTMYDEDPSNDPNPLDECVTGDIVGMCFCEFTGPAIAVTIDGSLQL